MIVGENKHCHLYKRYLNKCEICYWSWRYSNSNMHITIARNKKDHCLTLNLAMTHSVSLIL